MKHIEFTFAPDYEGGDPTIVICLSGCIDDHTLCGTNEGECGVSGIVSAVNTTKPLTCPTCIRIINYCKQVKPSQLAKVKKA